MQVVYHANYLVWCEIGRTEFIREVWGSYADVERGGVALAVVDASLRYHAPARYDDLVRVTTTVREVKSRTVIFDYKLENATTGQRLASASTTLIAFTRGATVTVLPPEMRTALEQQVAP